MSKFDQKNQKVERQINADKVSIGVTPIICPKCHFENQPKSKFCSECGISLTFKCPVCETESYLGAKFCSGCGNEINKIQQNIKIAQSKHGEQRELEYHFREKPPSGGNALYAIYNNLDPDLKRVARVTLDIDEYVYLQQGDNISVYKGSSSKPDAIGALYLTNKRLLFLGTEPEFHVGSIEWSYPLKEITGVSIDNSKALFMSMSYLKVLYLGKVRKFTVTENTIPSWVASIQKLLSENPTVKPEVEVNKSLFTCPKCNLPFKTDDDLKRHVVNWHKTG
jgi:hypothetical protein